MSRRSSARPVVLLLACAAIVGAAIAVGLHRGRAADHPTPLPIPAAHRFALEEGGMLYGAYCAPCHGASGKGDGRFYASSLAPAPPDFTAVAFSRSDRDLRDAIAKGSRGVGRSDLCPPWGRTLSSADVDEVARYIRELQHAQPSAPAARRN